MCRYVIALFHFSHSWLLFNKYLILSRLIGSFACSCRRSPRSASRRRRHSELRHLILGKADRHWRWQDCRLPGGGETEERRLGARYAIPSERERMHRSQPQGGSGIRVPSESNQWSRTGKSQHLHWSCRCGKTTRLDWRSAWLSGI